MGTDNSFPAGGRRQVGAVVSLVVLIEFRTLFSAGRSNHLIENVTRIRASTDWSGERSDSIMVIVAIGEAMSPPLRPDCVIEAMHSSRIATSRSSIREVTSTFRGVDNPQYHL